jgi:hypothetical protein
MTDNDWRGRAALREARAFVNKLGGRGRPTHEVQIYRQAPNLIECDLEPKRKSST